MEGGEDGQKLLALSVSRVQGSIKWMDWLIDWSSLVDWFDFGLSTKALLHHIVIGHASEFSTVWSCTEGGAIIVMEFNWFNIRSRGDLEHGAKDLDEELEGPILYGFFRWPLPLACQNLLERLSEIPTESGID